MEAAHHPSFSARESPRTATLTAATTVTTRVRESRPEFTGAVSPRKHRSFRSCSLRIHLGPLGGPSLSCPGLSMGKRVKRPPTYRVREIVSRSVFCNR